jgi:hypothetical protein
MLRYASNVILSGIKAAKLKGETYLKMSLSGRTDEARAHHNGRRKRKPTVR